MPDWRVLVVAVLAIFLLAPPAAVPPESEGIGGLVKTVLPSVVNISVKGKGQSPIRVRLAQRTSPTRLTSSILSAPGRSSIRAKSSSLIGMSSRMPTKSM